MGKGGFLCSEKESVEGSVFDIAHLEDRVAREKESDVKTKKDAQGLNNAPPGDGFIEQVEPGVEVIGEEPGLVIVKVRDLLQNAVHENKRQGQDGGSGRFHVKAGEHKTKSHHRAGFDDD